MSKFIGEIILRRSEVKSTKQEEFRRNILEIFLNIF